MDTSNTSEHYSREPALDLEEWRVAFSSRCFQCNLESDQARGFSGWVQPRSIFGLLAADLGLNSGRMERTHRYVRADGIEHYAALIVLAGRSTMIQNDHTVALGAGDIALFDAARPVTFNVCDNGPAEWLAARLPRRILAAHFGSEPQAGLRAPTGTLAGRLLVELARESSQREAPSPTQSEPYMELTIYDLLGALFAGADPSPVSAHTDNLFARVCDIIRNSFTDPELGPSEVAAEARVSLRYLQMLFTARGLTCTHFIQSIRLDHALRLVRRRNSTNTGQPLSEIAYICGFRDYNYFGRAFRHRFGYPPNAAGSDP